MYIGVDLGTTGCKVVLFDRSGKIVSQFNKEYPLICRGSFVEQDADKWWELVCEGITAVRGDFGSDIAGISVSTQGIAVVPVDIHGRAMANAISWLDTRAVEEKEYFEDTVGRDRKRGIYAAQAHVAEAPRTGAVRRGTQVPASA